MILKIKNIVLWIVVLCYFPVMAAFVASTKSTQLCSGINVEITDSTTSKFVNSSQIRNVILTKYPRILGGRLNEINSEELEVFLQKHEAIDNCEAYHTCGGSLNIFINQRKPLLRVFSGYNSYYIDEFGEVMPLFDQYTARVLVLSGHVNKLDSLNEVIKLVKYISKDPFWNAQIEQIYVEQNGDFTLSPRVGDQDVFLGSLDNYPKKMENLYALYTKGLHPREWNNYSSINLKYEGQIICTKR